MRFTSSNVRDVLWILVTIGASSWWASGAPAAEPLRWKFHVGDKLAFNVTQEMHLNLDGGPSGSLTATTEQVMDMTWHVEGVNEQGEAVVVGKIDRVQMKLKDAEQQELEYDSASEEPPTGIAAMNAAMYEAMTAGEYELTMTARGEVRDVVIPDDVRSAIQGSAGADASGEQMVEAFRAMITQGVFVLPEAPPAVGDEWSTSAAVNIPGSDNAAVETVYRYEGTRAVDGTSFAVIRPTLKMNLAGKPLMPMMVKEQNTNGEVLFNEDAGRLHSMSIRQNMTLDVRVNGQTMPGSIEQRVEVTVTPKED